MVVKRIIAKLGKFFISKKSVYVIDDYYTPSADDIAFAFNKSRLVFNDNNPEKGLLTGTLRLYNIGKLPNDEEVNRYISHYNVYWGKTKDEASKGEKLNSDVISKLVSKGKLTKVVNKKKLNDYFQLFIVD